MKEPMSIEKMAEKLGVNFYDLHPLITAREDWLKQEGRREVVEWIIQNGNNWQYADHEAHYYGETYWHVLLSEWQAKLKEWGI